MGPDDDLRGDIEAAMSGEPAAEPSPAPEPSPPAPAADPGPGVAAVPKPGEAAGEPATRDALGRFVKKDGAAAAGPGMGTPASATPGTGQPPTTAAPIPPAPPPPTTLQPPAGWGPAVREHWAGLPQPVQEYVLQREYQMQRWANDTAPLRNAGEQFLRAIEPHRMTIQAEGVDPYTAVANLMQVGTTLRFGTPVEKARVIADCVQTYGIDIQTLDSILAGVAPQQGQAPQINVQAEVQRALQPMMSALQQRQQWEAHQTTESARQELIAFASDQGHEFIDDVREIMADMIEVAAKYKHDLPLQEAYDRACALHPEVSKVIMARQQGVNAQKLTQNAQRAKAAAVSVRGAAPAGKPDGSHEPSSLRDSIEAAIEAHSRV